MTADLVNGAALAAVGCRVDVSIAKRAGGLARTVDGTGDGHGNDAAADDDLATDEAAGRLANVVEGSVFVEPDGMLEMAAPADDLEMAELCGSN